MTKDDLQPEQLRALAVTTARTRDYLRKLRARMEMLKFRTDDSLYAAVCRAYDEISNVTVVASTTATRREGTRRGGGPTIMEQHPWGGDR